MLLRRFLKMRAQLFKRSLVFLFVLYFIGVGDIVKKSFQKWSGRGEVVIAIWGELSIEAGIGRWGRDIWSRLGNVRDSANSGK